MDRTLEFAPFFRKAFALAEQGKGEVEPNPLVGALVLEGGKVIGRGYHHYYGGDHAEIEALKEANGRGDTLLVTLEPCSTQGKTPPCVWKIVDSKIRRIVVGALDPFPQHQGVGLQVLRNSNREVIQVNFQLEWEKQNRSFLRFLKHQRPWVIAKWAMTMDGKIASHSGDSKWVSSSHSKEEVWKLRGRCEAVVVGVGTVLADDPLLTPHNHPNLGKPPLRVVFDSMLRTPANSKLVAGKEGKTIFLASSKAAKVREKNLIDAGCEVIRVGKDGKRPAIREALAELWTRGVRRLLLEGGSKLNGAFFEEDCIDQVICYIAPKLIGGDKALSPIAGKGIEKMEKSLNLHHWNFQASGDDLKMVGFI